MSVENISFILMKSSFTIYEDIKTTSIKYTQTHVHWVQDVLDVFTVTKYREKLLVITQFRSHVWFWVPLRPGRGGWVGQGGGVQRLMPSEWKQLQWTQKYWLLPPSLPHPLPSPSCWCLHVQQLATRNLAERERHQYNDRNYFTALLECLGKLSIKLLNKLVNFHTNVKTW